MRFVLIILGMILVVAAVVGGLAIDSLLWLLLIAALVVFAIGVFTGRIDEPEGAFRYGDADRSAATGDRGRRALRRPRAGR